MGQKKKHDRHRGFRSLVSAGDLRLPKEYELFYAATPTRCDVCGDPYQSMMMYKVGERRICYICIKDLDRSAEDD
jgi:formylmethanofuran dehydrogenase subunit E